MLNNPDANALTTKRIPIATAFGMQMSRITKSRAERSAIRLIDKRLPRQSFEIIISGITIQEKDNLI